MASLQVAVLTFTPIVGTGTQTITGVVDSNGTPFVGKLFLFTSGNVLVNQIGDDSRGNSACFDMGSDTGSIGGSTGAADQWQFPFLGLKIASDGGGHRYSILDVQGDAFFGGSIQRAAFVSSVSSGSFDIQYDLNNRTGDVTVTVLGGDDLTVDLAAGISGNGFYSTSPFPKGLVWIHQTYASVSSPKDYANGAGGGLCGMGWATDDEVHGSNASFVQSQNTNYSYQDSTWWNTSSTGTGGMIASDWVDDGFTKTQVGGCEAEVFIFCGETLRSAAGSFIQKETPGFQVVSTGIHAKWVYFSSVGLPAESDPNTGTINHTWGWTNGVNQSGYWYGESTVGNPGVGVPLKGARYLSNDSVLRFGEPLAGATTFNSVAQMLSVGANGDVVLNWTDSDGEPREILWFALGVDEEPPPPVTTQTFLSRRVRRFQLPYADNQFVFLKRLEFIFQPGIGYGQGQAQHPVAMIRLSRDGGETWGNEIQLGAGDIGQYETRMYAVQLGRYRDGICELVVTDPNDWNFLACEADVEVGTS